jgi:hypothetical protein
MGQALQGWSHRARCVLRALRALPALADGGPVAVLLAQQKRAGYDKLLRMALSIRGLAWTSVLGTLLLAVYVLPKAMSQEGNASPAAVRSAGTSAESLGELHSVPVADARGHVVYVERAFICITRSAGS